MTEGHIAVVPLDEVILKTVVLGYRATLEMMGVDPNNADTEDVLIDFDAWMDSKIAESPAAEFIRTWGAEWDLIETTDGYDQFADDIGAALDRIRGKK